MLRACLIFWWIVPARCGFPFALTLAVDLAWSIVEQTSTSSELRLKDWMEVEKRWTNKRSGHNYRSYMPNSRGLNHSTLTNGRCFKTWRETFRKYFAGTTIAPNPIAVWVRSLEKQ